jgi:intracellular sulfur oxidation DsrE/DsrF family protein
VSVAAPAATAQAPRKMAEQSKDARAAQHKVAIQVNQNDKAVMDLALNNARNIIDYYKSKGETVAIEIVTYGPGLHMLRADTSPVKDRIAPMSMENPNLTFIACANTQANQSKAEGKQVTLLSEAKVMPSGVVRLIELQKVGYAYIRP